MTAYNDWSTLAEGLAETISRSRLLDLARRGLGINRTLPESAAIDAAIIEALATANNGPPVVADDAALAARFPVPLNDQLAQVQAAGYVKRYDQAAGAWRPEAVTGAAGPVARPLALGAAGTGAGDDGAFVQSAHDNALDAEILGGTFRVATNRTFANGLSIRRGGKIKAAAGATVTIGRLVAGNYQIFDVSENATGIVFADGAVPEVLVDWFGGGAGKSAAVNVAALRAAYAALPPGGGTVKFLMGTYDFGIPPALPLASGEVDPYRAVVRIARDNVRFQGMGMGKTILTFATTGGSAFGLPGSLDLFVYNMKSNGLAVVPGGIDKQFISDLTIIDTDTVGTIFAGAWGCAVNGLLVKNMDARNLEFVNGKTNGCFTLLGDAPDNTTPGTGDLVMENIWCRSQNRAGGLYNTGDWANVQHFGRIFIRNFHVPPTDGCDRHALEFGTGIGELYVEDSIIDMNGQGKSCLASFTILKKGHFKNVTMANWTNGNGAVDVDPDIPTQPIYNLRVLNCSFKGNLSGTGGMEISAGDIKNLEISGCYFDCFAHIVVAKWPKGVFRMVNNTHCFSENGGNLALLDSGNPAPPDADSFMDFANNSLHGTATPKLFNIDSWTNLRTYGAQVKGAHTTRNIAPSTGQFDGSANDYSIGLFSGVPDGSVSAVFHLFLKGVLPSDHIKWSYRNANRPPAGVVLHIEVDPAVTDQLNVWYYNKSGGSYGGTGQIDLRLSAERV